VQLQVKDFCCVCHAVFGNHTSGGPDVGCKVTHQALQQQLSSPAAALATICGELSAKLLCGICCAPTGQAFACSDSKKFKKQHTWSFVACVTRVPPPSPVSSDPCQISSNNGGQCLHHHCQKFRKLCTIGEVIGVIDTGVMSSSTSQQQQFCI